MTLTEQARSLTAKKLSLERAKIKADAGWPGLAAPAYMQWQDKNVSTAVCKCCGARIMLDGQRLPQYAEIMLSFNDRSAHVTNLCKTCRSSGLSLDTLDALYCADLLVLAAEEEMQDVLMRWELMATRKVIGFKEV